MATTSQYNDISPELKKKIIPLEPGQVATYRLLGEPVVREGRDEDDRVVHTRTYARQNLKPTETIYDAPGKKMVRLAFVRGVLEPATVAGGQPREKIEPIFFNDRGEVEVDHTNPVLYMRLELSDKNRDSVNPGKRVPPTGLQFFRVQPEFDAKAILKKKQLALAAAAGISEMTVLKDLQVVAEKLAMPIQSGRRLYTASELQVKLIELAEMEPERVDSALEATELKLAQLIRTAVELKIISFNKDASEWRIAASQDRVTPALAGYEPEESLVRYIQQNTAGPAFSQMLVKQIEAAQKK